MAIGTVEFDLSLKNPETGEYLTARTYTVEGVTNADGTPRELSIGQLVMAICLHRASRLENGYPDPVTGEHVPGIIDLMEEMNTTSAQLESLTEIDQMVVDYFAANANSHVLTLSTCPALTKGLYAGMTVHDALRAMEMGTDNLQYIRDDAILSSADILASDIEDQMDSMNSFSQQKMIELQSQTSKRDQTYDMISNVLKSLNTVLVGIANNI